MLIGLQLQIEGQGVVLRNHSKNSGKPLWAPNPKQVPPENLLEKISGKETPDLVLSPQPGEATQEALDYRICVASSKPSTLLGSRARWVAVLQNIEKFRRDGESGEGVGYFTLN